MLFSFGVLWSSPPKHQSSKFQALYRRRLILIFWPTNTNNTPEESGNNFSQTNVEASATSEVQATTIFNDDAGITTSSIDNPASIYQKMFSSSSDNFNQDIKTFLSKPVILQSNTLGNTDTVSSFPTMLMPSTLIQTFSTINNKLQGYLGIRATMVFRLQVNANPFQQGRYMLTWVPLGGTGINAATVGTHYNPHIQSLVQRSTLPRVELDLACDTHVVLRVPYVSSKNFYPLAGQSSTELFGSLGYLTLFPYVTLNGIVNQTAGYTIWGHFEDIELVGVTVPQSGAGFSNTDREAKAIGVQPLSNSLSLISKASGTLSKVPFIGDYATGISWLSERLAKTAMVFGWSRPASMEPTKRMYRSTLQDYCNVDAVDYSQMLSLSSKNQLHVLPGFSGTNTDEMDFSFIASIPAFDQLITWNFSDGIGLRKMTKEVCPLENVNTFTLAFGGVVANNYKPIDFVSRHFTYWRGSIVYTFKFVKTNFHSGRLAICFAPFEDISSAPRTLTLPLSAFTHRHIVDIRETNMVTLTIPYISSTPFRNTLVGNGNSTGLIEIYVIDPLTGPSTVPNQIPIIVEISAGPDFEVAVPRQLNHAPAVNVVPQSGAGFSNTNSACAMTDTTLGVSSMSSDDHLNAAACVGEKISSFRTMLKSFNFLPYQNPVAAANKFLNIAPFNTPVYFDAVANAASTQVADLYTILSSIYLFSRGSVRLKINMTGASGASSSNSFSASLFAVPVDNLSISSISNLNALGLTGTTAVSTSNILRTYSHLGQNLCAEIQVPQYNMMHSRVNWEHVASPNISTPVFSGRSKVVVSITNLSMNIEPTVGIHRAGGDDCNFGCFISIPPMVSVMAGTVPI